MSDKLVIELGSKTIVLIIPDKSRDIKYSESNNINYYDENMNLIWNIEELLKDFSHNNDLKYYKEMYFDIRLMENGNLFCVGFINHCEISLKSNRIIKIINNR